MCGSMVDIQSPAAEIRWGKKDRKIERKIVTTGQKYNDPLFYTAAITTAKSKNEFVGRVNIVPSFPILPLPNRHFGPKGPDNPCKHKYANFCLKCSRIAGIPASYGKSGSINTILTSDFRPEVEIRQFRACTLKNMQCNPYLWPNRRNFRAL